MDRGLRNTRMNSIPLMPMTPRKLFSNVESEPTVATVIPGQI